MMKKRIAAQRNGTPRHRISELAGAVGKNPASRILLISSFGIVETPKYYL
jgi:hypothetical protein